MGRGAEKEEEREEETEGEREEERDCATSLHAHCHEQQQSWPRPPPQRCLMQARTQVNEAACDDIVVVIGAPMRTVMMEVGLETVGCDAIVMVKATIKPMGTRVGSLVMCVGVGVGAGTDDGWW